MYVPKGTGTYTCIFLHSICGNTTVSKCSDVLLCVDTEHTSDLQHGQLFRLLHSSDAAGHHDNSNFFSHHASAAHPPAHPSLH